MKVQSCFNVLCREQHCKTGISNICALILEKKRSKLTLKVNISRYQTKSVKCSVPFYFTCDPFSVKPNVGLDPDSLGQFFEADIYWDFMEFEARRQRREEGALLSSCQFHMIYIFICYITSILYSIFHVNCIFSVYNVI